MEEETKRLQLRVGGMGCSFCVQTITKAYTHTKGVKEVHVSLAHEEALIEYDPQQITELELKDVLKSLGYTIRDPRKVEAFEEQKAQLRSELQQLLTASSFTAISLVLMLTSWFGFKQPWFMFVMPALALLTVFYAGRNVLYMAWGSLRRRILNQHVLLEFSAFSGLAGGFLGFIIPRFPMSDFFAVSVFVTTYHLLSGYVSSLVRAKASESVKKLLSLQPLTANVILEGKEQEINIEEVRINDMVIVRPGEKIPVDGFVVEGTSSVDQSLVTGESIPVKKTIDDEVIGGSINQEGVLLIRVLRIGDESFLRRVAKYVEEAKAMKPGIVQLVDRILKIYVPAVITVAGTAFLAWILGSYLITGEINIVRAVFAAISVFVMGYPCALGMATPLALIRGGGIAAEKGILMRSGDAFQIFKDIDTIVFDKTGTLTEGKPQVKEIIPLADLENNELLVLAARVEKPSEHPIAKAIVKKAEERNIEIKSVKDFKAYPGEGIEADVDGKDIIIGTLRFLEKLGIEIKGHWEIIKLLEGKGWTVIGLSVNKRLVGFLSVADTIKQDALEAISYVKDLKIEPIMITGDNEITARAVAEQLGIERVMARVLPDEKAEKIRSLQREGRKVAMVGDGINDAPSLMQADIGIAIGSGTDIAIESADIIIIGERLTSLIDAFYISRNSYKKTVQNLTLAFMFNGIGVPLAVTGFLHPIWAMIAMIASVSTVLLNSFVVRLVGRIKPAEKKRQIIFFVSNMHCEGCLGIMRDALQKEFGSMEIDADLEKHLLKITFSGEDLTDAKMKGILAKAGYKAEKV